MNKKLAVIIFVFLICNHAYSDEWVVPVSQEIYSQNGLYCLVINPAIIPKNYYKEIEKRNTNPEKYKDKIIKDSIIPCHATLYKTGENYLDRKILWTRDLENPISPYTAIVTNDGKYVITFDDWYHLGNGENVMVIYGEYGNLLRKFELNEITSLSNDQFMTSVTSIWWYQGIETYSEYPTRILILVKDKDFNIEKRKFNLDVLKFEE